MASKKKIISSYVPVSLVLSAHYPLSLLSQIGEQEVSEEESCRPSDNQLDGDKQYPNTSQSVLMSLVQLTGIVLVVLLTLHGNSHGFYPRLSIEDAYQKKLSVIVPSIYINSC